MRRHPHVPSLPGLAARLLAGAALLLSASAAPAADLYFSGNLVMSGATAEATGSTPFFTISGDDVDSSPGYGGSLGIGIGLEEMLPAFWGVEEAGLGLRWEFEGVLGRDFELRSEGGDGFFTDATSWSAMTNLFLDVPIHPPLARLIGRVPILQPLSIYGGGGMGFTNLDIETTDNISRGVDTATNFSWQAGAGLSYEFTEWATITAGWRYLDMGEVEADLVFLSGGTPFGNHALDFTAHEFVSSLRFDFYTRPFDELSPRTWSLPRMPSWKLPWRRSE